VQKEFIFVINSNFIMLLKIKSFSNEVCQFLTGKNIPEFITNLPREALNT